MLRRINPIVLACLAIVLVLSIGVFAVARPGGVTGADALGVGESQLGKPFAMSTDGPGSFSCTGLMRYILRTTGVDPDAPWTPEEYLNRYAPVDLANLQPGDIVIMPNWATMYAGDGMLLNANEWEGVVKYTPLEYAGTPVGAVRPPYSGSESGATQPPLNDATTGQTATEPVAAGPVATEPTVTGQMPGEQPVADDPLMSDPLMSDPLMSDPLMSDPLMSDPLMSDPLVVEQPVAVEQAPAIEPVATELPVQF